MNEHPYDRILRKRFARRHGLILAGGAAAATLLAACGSSAKNDGGGGDADDDQNVARPAGWEADSHGKNADPNYSVVFPADRVLEVAITVTPENWQKMLDDMTALFGARGSGGGARGGQPGVVQGGVAPQGGGPQIQGGPGAGGGDFTSANPIWVPGTVAFNSKTWTNVGVRFKGNSTLSNAWRNGVDKMPLKLDFDQFEAEYPEIQDQRFYGFKQFSLSNNQNDQTFMRETTAYQILEDAGLPAAKTAPWLITFDHGEGPKRLGLYTAIEVIDDTVVSRVFKKDSGNIYEGDGRAASFAAGTESQIESSFQAEGGDNPDWSDVKALYNAIHASNRTTDAAAWRKGMEEIFDIDGFLEWLGIAATLQHWDTYGGMTHNYFLYNNPESGRMTWISWDHNEVLGQGGGAGAGGPAAGGIVRNQQGQAPPAGNAQVQGAIPGGGPGRGNVSFDKSSVGDEWPLISFLMDQPEYVKRYNEFLKSSVSLFDIGKLSARYRERAAFLKPYVTTDTTEASFTAAVTALTQTTQSRLDALKAHVATL